MILSSLLNIDILSGYPHLDKATYNYPWVNTGIVKSTPSLLKVYPYALLIVIAKHNLTGNYNLENVIQSLSPSVLNFILGNNITSFLYSPVEIFASIKLLCNFNTIAL